MSQHQEAYVAEPLWSDIQRDVHAAREVLKRQERQQVATIDQIKAELKAQQQSQENSSNEL